MIEGGKGGTGATPEAAGDAIHGAESSASIGPIEPLTWAMLALGFLGLSGLGLRKCKRADESGYGVAFLNPVSTPNRAARPSWRITLETAVDA